MNKNITLRESTRYDFHIYQNATYTKTITLTDESGSAIDVSARTWQAQIRTVPNSYYVESGIVVNTISGSQGIISLTVFASQSTDLIYTNYVYDVMGTDTGSNVVIKELYGDIRVVPDVSR